MEWACLPTRRFEKRRRRTSLTSSLTPTGCRSGGTDPAAVVQSALVPLHRGRRPALTTVEAIKGVQPSDTWPGGFFCSLVIRIPLIIDRDWRGRLSGRRYLPRLFCCRLETFGEGPLDESLKDVSSYNNHNGERQPKSNVCNVRLV